MAETATRKTKLHELLAVEKNLANQAGKTRAELSKTFSSKHHLFAQKLVTYVPVTEGEAGVTEEQTDIQTTVRDEIKWLAPILTKAMDASHQIDMANTMAKADVVSEDGRILLSGMPTTSLLRLEHTVQEIHDLIVTIPTLDPAKGFSLDTQRGVGVYKARDVRKARAKKEFKPVIMVPATPQHPAQVEKLYEDVVTGFAQTQEWSAMLTPDTKAKLLDRCDQLARAVKRARARANEQEVDVHGNTIGKTLLDYVFEPIS